MPMPVREALGLEVPPIEICDVGAMLEGRPRYAELVDQGLARVTGFEPDRAQLARLAAEGDADHRYLPYVLGRGGPATFHVARYPGCSSLYEADPAVIDLFSTIGAGPGGNFTVVAREAVTTTPLDDVAECPPPDLLKIDVQGAELDVLRGASRALARAVVVECEVEFVPVYKGQPLFGALQVFLHERGFLLHKFLDIAGRTLRPLERRDNRFAPMSQVLWADAVFVRDFTRLDGYDDAQLVRAAAILHAVYCSYDLACRLLLEYDRRRDTSLAARYTERVFGGANLPLLYMTLKLHP